MTINSSVSPKHQHTSTFEDLFVVELYINTSDEQLCTLSTRSSPGKLYNSHEGVLTYAEQLLAVFHSLQLIPNS